MTKIDTTAGSADTARPADAELLIAPGCAHCPQALDTLAKLTKEGLIGRLQVTNVSIHPEAAQAVGTRSVPWIRIGRFELEGAHSPGELRDWAEQAAAGAGMGAYLGYLIEQQRLPRVVQLIKERPSLLHELVPLLGDLETPMGVRIGIGAVVEELQDSGLLAGIVAELGALTRAAEPQVRADACHYLGLTGAAEAAEHIRPLLEDSDAEVREIAAESLPMLPTATQK
jgi:HEAT repeat protein